METLVHPFTSVPFYGHDSSVCIKLLSKTNKLNKTKKKTSTKTEMSEKVANVHRKTLKDLQN